MVESLFCDAMNCIYNSSKKCNAPTINVVGGTTRDGSDTYCATFTEEQDSYSSGQGNAVNSAAKGPQFTDDSQGVYTDTPGVYCNATNCTYNDSNVCYAKGIRILGENETPVGSTECETFRPE